MMKSNRDKSCVAPEFAFIDENEVDALGWRLHAWYGLVGHNAAQRHALSPLKYTQAPRFGMPLNGARHAVQLSPKSFSLLDSYL
jgi:hypothetical protein